jgi:hypothetical protein
MRRRPLAPLALLLLALPLELPASAEAARKPPAPEPAAHPEDLYVVHCLLPAPLRRLGRYATIEGARRVVKTTAQDCRLRGGEYGADRADLLFALRVWLDAAGGGDAEAQNAVGELLDRGAGGAPDSAAAAVWYRKSADQGFARAQINLGHLYERGLGVERDPLAALGWYRRAAGLPALPGEAAAAAERRRAEALANEVGELERELDAARAELDAARGELERLRASGAAAAAAAQPAQKVRSLAERLAGYEERLAELRRGATAPVPSPGPSIAFLRPDVLATRGPALVALPPGTTSVEVLGRVESPLGVASLRADDRPLEADARGEFRFEVAVSGRRELVVTAVDRAGGQTRATLWLQPAGAAGEVPTAAPAPPGAAELAALGHRRFRALLIANAEYRSLPALPSARGDAEALAELLAKEYGFETTLLIDATQLDLLRAFDGLRRELTAEHDLLIYYAGHGRVEAASGRGFWLPVDADAEKAERWVPNELIADLLDTIPARRALVVADSCYAGTLTRAGLGAEPSAPGTAFAERRARTALTSGGLEPVLDPGATGRSIFARALLTVLTLNRTPVAASQLFPEVATRVAYFAGEAGLEQRSGYGPIQWAGHEGGDFVFLPRAGALPARPAPGR